MAIVRILREGPAIDAARHLKRSALHDFAHQSFDAPIFVHEAHGQIIQQLRMRRLVAKQAEIVGRFDQPRPNRWLHTRLTITRPSKGLSREAIHCASCKRPLSCGPIFRRLFISEHGQQTARHDRAKNVDFAADAKFVILRLAVAPPPSRSVDRGRPSPLRCEVPEASLARRRCVASPRPSSSDLLTCWPGG